MRSDISDDVANLSLSVISVLIIDVVIVMKENAALDSGCHISCITNHILHVYLHLFSFSLAQLAMLASGKTIKPVSFLFFQMLTMMLP